MKKMNFNLALPLSILLIGLIVTSCGGKKEDTTVTSSPYPYFGNRPSPPVTETKKPVEDLSTVYYDYDKSNIRFDQQTTLDKNGEILRTNSDISITIEGHCDNRGTNEYNMALGDRRARSARDYMINLGIDPSRVDTVSYGEERPACREESESCWSLNRRAEFVK